MKVMICQTTDVCSNFSCDKNFYAPLQSRPHRTSNFVKFHVFLLNIDRARASSIYYSPDIKTIIFCKISETSTSSCYKIMFFKPLQYLLHRNSEFLKFQIFLPILNIRKHFFKPLQYQLGKNSEFLKFQIFWRTLGVTKTSSNRYSINFM